MKDHKILVWGLLFTGIILALLLITFYPIPSLLKWQSGLLARCFFILMLCFGFCLLRLMVGPTPADRAVAVDTLGILIVGFCALLSIATGRDWYIDIAIAWALQSFIGALALAKYLEGKGFDE
ncbi:MAG: cation:proton antiporter [Candidatus Omnitrophota bacterium]